MVDGLLANLGVGIVLRFRSSLQATGFAVLSRTEFRLLHFDSESEACLTEESIRSTKQIPCFRSQTLVAAQHPTKTWNDCQLTGNVEKFATASWLDVLEFSRIVHKVHSVLQLLYSSLTFSQFLPGAFVNSHFLNSLQFFYFMGISDASISKCFFSLSQFFVKFGLLSSRNFTKSSPLIFR